MLVGRWEGGQHRGAEGKDGCGVESRGEFVAITEIMVVHCAGVDCVVGAVGDGGFWRWCLRGRSRGWKGMW